jgi:leucine proline-enriched proteoglycan (leprecan)
VISKKAANLYLDVSEYGRLLVEKYFNLTQPLYFDFTHLVCRTAVEGKPGQGWTAVEGKPGQGWKITP